MFSVVTRPHDQRAVPESVGPRRDPLALGRLRWADVAALVVLLTVALWWMPSGPFTVDEGEVLLQQDGLDRTGEWEVTYPAAELDPTGQWFPVYLIERDGMRFLPHIKHPAWQTALRPVFAAAGSEGLAGVHALALIGSAWAAAMLARRLGSDRERSVFWAVGALSPVTVGTFIGLGHAVGALAVTGGLTALVTASESSPLDERRHLRRVGVAGAAGCFCAGILVRNEVVLAALVVAFVLLWRRRWRAAAVIAVAVLGTYAFNNAWLQAIWGPDSRPFRVVDLQEGWLAGRMSGVFRSLVGVDGGVMGIVAALLAVIGAWSVAGGKDGSVRVRAGVLLIVIAPVVVLVDGSIPTVSGLLIVSPGLIIAAARMPRLATSDPAWSVAASLALATAAIIATQYSDGGGAQWGGRFFHILVPAALAVAIARCRVPSRQTAAVIVVAGLLWTGAGWLTVSNVRSVHGRVLQDVALVADRTTSQHELPVVAGDLRVLGALAWKEFDDWRAMNVPRDELDSLAGRLDDADVEAWTLIWTAPSPPDRVGAYEQVDARRDVTGSMWIVSMVRP